MGLFKSIGRFFTVGNCRACNKEKEFDKMNHTVTDLLTRLENANGLMIINERHPELLKLKNILCPEGSPVCDECWNKYIAEMSVLKEHFDKFRANGIRMDVEAIGLYNSGKLTPDMIDIIKDNVILYAVDVIRYYNFDHYNAYDVLQEVLENLIGDELIEKEIDIEEVLLVYRNFEYDILRPATDINYYMKKEIDIHAFMAFANKVIIINQLINNVKVKKGIEEFKNNYNNAIIKKNSVKLYNINYGKDFSHLGGYVFTIPCTSCKSVRAYDRVKFYAALWGYDIAYNVYYNGNTVSGVMTKRKK